MNSPLMNDGEGGPGRFLKGFFVNNFRTTHSVTAEAKAAATRVDEDICTSAMSREMDVVVVVKSIPRPSRLICVLAASAKRTCARRHVGHWELGGSGRQFTKKAFSTLHLIQLST